MIRKSLMAVTLFFYSINVISQTETMVCDFSDKTRITNLSSDFNLFGIDTAHKLVAEFTPIPNEAHAETSLLFHVRKNKSSLAESMTVMLFIPGLIILLFSRLTKSAK